MVFTNDKLPDNEKAQKEVSESFKEDKKIWLDESIQNFLLKKSLNWDKKENIEIKVKNLNDAIESIYIDNDWIVFNWEIDNEDIINNELISKYRLDKSLEWKNLKELKEHLDIENKKLFNIYKITWESHKKQDLLKKEIKFYAWIGDKYEWGANYFKLDTKEIRNKVVELCSTMSLIEIFDYIKNINKNIEWNFRRSDMVEQVNLKLINALYEYSFDRLKKEDPDNKEFIKFIKLITGRWTLEVDSSIKYENRQEFDYENLDVDENFKAKMIANKVLIHVMYKKWWLLEEIKNKKKIKLEDKELEWKTPSWVLGEANNFFNNSIQNKIPNYWEQILNKLWYSEKLNKPYEDLSFEEKINIWSLARLLKEFKKLNPNDLQNKEVLQELSKKMIKDSFDDLNESLSNNFNETLFDWDGISAEDLGLKGTDAEIFQLYQDINWNEWLFDWKDGNEPWMWTIAFTITLAAWILILWPILVWWAAALTFQAWLIAWAQIGFVAWISEQVFSHKWYDTYKEWIIDVWSQISIEIIISALLTWTWLSTLKKLWVTLNPDLLFSLKAWFTKAWLIDKWFILWEVWATYFISNEISSRVKKSFKENHTDTDKK